jgi:hypothetical protein
LCSDKTGFCTLQYQLNTKLLVFKTHYFQFTEPTVTETCGGQMGRTILSPNRQFPL